MPRARSANEGEDVFINCPFDPRFEKLYVAYIAGLTGLGLTPRCVLELPAGGANRLERLFELIAKCPSSVHDLSHVRLDTKAPRVPRFNMPFELGLAAAVRLSNQNHNWFVFEKVPYRIQKSLSDIGGVDPLIHGGTPDGVLRELANAFDREDAQPSTSELLEVHRGLRKVGLELKRRYQTDSLFSAALFRRLVLAARDLADQFGIPG